MSRESRVLAGVILVTVPMVTFGALTLFSFLVAGFFLSTLSPTATEAGPLAGLVDPGALALAAGVLTLGVGLIRAPRY